MIQGRSFHIISHQKGSKDSSLRWNFIRNGKQSTERLLLADAAVVVSEEWTGRRFKGWKKRLRYLDEDYSLRSPKEPWAGGGLESISGRFVQKTDTKFRFPKLKSFGDAPETSNGTSSLTDQKAGALLWRQEESNALNRFGLQLHRNYSTFSVPLNSQVYTNPQQLKTFDTVLLGLKHDGMHVSAAAWQLQTKHHHTILKKRRYHCIKKT